MNPPRPPSRFAKHPCRTTFSLHRFTVSLLVLTPICILPPGVHANLPTGAHVVHGNVAISQAGGAMNIQQASRHAIVNWQSFNVGAANQLRIAQSGADAAMLARVVGNDPSQLLGSIQANGKLFLINPKGVVVGEGATIDTAAFMASTLDVSDREFLAGGPMTFKGDSGAGIVNLGKITAHEGNVMLFAQSVKNTGQLHAAKGAAVLAAGNEIYAASADAPSVVIKFTLPSAAGKTGVENSGTIEAAQAELKAAGGSIYDLAVNQSGLVRALGIERKNGRVLLTADGGDVAVSGTVIARNADGSGGEILVGGDYQGKNAAIPNAARTTVTATAKLDASATIDSAGAGRAIVWADDTTSFFGHLSARGAGGGFAEVSGKRFLDYRPQSVLDLGLGGSLLLDPGSIMVAAADPGFGISWLDVATLEAQLATTDVTLNTDAEFGTISFNASVTWSSTHTLTAIATGNIFVNESISAPDGTLALYSGKPAHMPDNNGQDINPRTTLTETATIVADRLVVGVNPSALPADWTPIADAPRAANLEGNLTIGTLEVDLAGGATGVETHGADNTIGAFETSGAGDLTEARVTNHHGDLAVKLATTNSSATEIVVTTPGKLTLQSGSSVSFANPANVILASTNDAFVNEAGAAVFGANAHYQIYTSTTGATTKDGLTGLNVFSTTFDADNPTGGAGGTNRFFFSAAGAGALQLTYKANDATRFYGDPNPTFGFSVTGRDDDAVAWDVTGAPALSTTATQQSGVAQYAIAIAQGTLASTDGNYTFAFTPGTLTIDRAPLTITANDASRKLNRNNPAFTASFDGLKNSDTSAVVSGLQFTTPATISSLAGDYEIMPANGTAANYTLTFEPGTLTVGGVARLLIDADDVARLYGSANPAFTASITGFEDGENSSIVTGLDFDTAATQSSGVGAYTITPFGASAAGYEIDYATGTLTIERAPLAITPNSKTRVYGDANDLTATYSGLVNGDSASVVSGLVFNTSATPASSVGTYPVTLFGGTADNYAITTSGSAVLTINPATISVRIDDKTRLYGEVNPEFTYSVLGLKNGDSPANAVLFGAGPTSFAGQQADVGTYSIFGSSVVAGSGNYALASVTNGTLSVTKRPLTITADDKTKVYGDRFPAYTATFDGLASFDSPSVISGLELALPADVKDGAQTVAIFASGGTNSNYDITHRNGLLTITPAMLSLDALPDLVRVYGRENPSGSEITAATLGLRNGDSIASLGLDFIFPALTADTGTYSYTISQRNPNYAVPATGGGTFHVQPAPLTLAVNGTRVYGTVEPQLTFHATGLVFGQDLSVLDLSQVTTTASLLSATTNVGNYVMSAGGATARNYTITHASGLLQITPATLVVTPFSYGFLSYGEALPVFNYAVTGLAPGETRSVLTGTTLTSYETGIAPGDYPIEVTNPGTAPNYNVVAGPAGNLNIARRQLTIAAPSFTVGSDAVPATVPVNQPLLFPGGPQFTVEGHVGPKDETFVSAVKAIHPITPTLVPLAGTTQADIDRYYTIALVPGQLDVETALKVMELNLPPIDPAVYETKNTVTIQGHRTADGVPVMLHQDFMALVQDDLAWFDSEVAAMWSSGAFLDADGKPLLSAEAMELARAWANGDAEAGEKLMARYTTDPELRAAFMPMFTGYALELFGRSTETLTKSQRELMTTLGTRVNALRASIAENALAKYLEYQKEENERRMGEGLNAMALSMRGLFGPPSDWSLKEKNIAQEAQEEVMGHAIANVAAGLVGVAAGVVYNLPEVQRKIFPKLRAGQQLRNMREAADDAAEAGAKTTGKTAAKSAKNAVRGVAKVVTQGLKMSGVGAILGASLEAIVEIAFVVDDHIEGDKNLAAYKAALEEGQAAKEQGKMVLVDLHEPFGPTLEDNERSELMVAILQTLLAAEQGLSATNEGAAWDYDLAPKS